MEKFAVPTFSPQFPASVSFNSNSLIYFFFFGLLFAIVAITLPSVTNAISNAFCKDEEKKIRIKKQLKTVLRVLLTLLVPFFIILIDIIIFNLRFEYQTTGWGKNYSSSDFIEMTYYGVGVIIFSLVLLIVELVIFIKKRKILLKNKCNLIVLLLNIVILALYSYHCYEIITKMHLFK